MKLVFGLFGKSKEDSHPKNIAALSPKQNSNQNSNKDGTIDLDASQATVISLPYRNLDPWANRQPSDQNWTNYWRTYNKAYSYYNRHMYQKAKDEFLKIYDSKEHAGAFYTHLLRVYRQLIKKVINKDAVASLALYDELFLRCSNYTNKDIRQYNNILAENQSSTIGRKPREAIPEEPEYVFESTFLNFVSESTKPKGWKLPKPINYSFLNIISESNFLPNKLPYLEIIGSLAVFHVVDTLPELSETPWRIDETADRNSLFIVTKGNKNLIHVDRDLNILSSFDLSHLAENHTEIRNLRISNDQTRILITAVDKAYIYDFNLKPIAKWRVPIKEGLTKDENSGTPTSQQDILLSKYFKMLGVSETASEEEIRQSFRRLALQCHPDTNPDDPNANEKMIALKEAYEAVMHEDARNAFRGEIEEEHWVKILSRHTFQAGGLEFTFTASLSMDPNDWIYGAGISQDGSTYYLGCYSGKTYAVGHDGVVKKVFIMPKTGDGFHGEHNPISFIFDRTPYLHILSYSYLYIVNDDEPINVIAVGDTNIKWWDKGFLLLSKDKQSLVVYDDSGLVISKLKFNSSIKTCGYKENNFWIETAKKIYIFSLNIQNLDNKSA